MKRIFLLGIWIIPISVLISNINTLSVQNAKGPSAFAIEDTLFSEPYTDIDEWRDQPVRHRYVHGGFKGTETRFSFYFPPKEQYEGRFGAILGPTLFGFMADNGFSIKALFVIFSIPLLIMGLSVWSIKAKELKVKAEI